MRMSGHSVARYTEGVATKTILLLGLTLFTAFPLSSAQCQDTSAPDASDTQARRLYSLGSDAFEAERFSEAAVYFLEAYDVTPLPDLLFNAGAAHQRAEEDAEAVAVFERYLENHDGGSHEAEVNARLVVLRRRLVDTNADPNTNADADDPSTLDLSAEAPAPSRAVPLTLIIGGAVSAAAGATFLILAGGARSTVEDGSGFYSSVEAEDSRASTFGLVGGVALGVGAALAGVGVVLWATGGADNDGDANASSGLRVGLGHAEWTTSW